MTALLCVKEQHVPRRTCTQKGRPWRSCKQWGQLWGQQVPCASSDGGRPRPHRDTAGRWVTRGRGSRPAATGQSSCLEHDRYRCVTSGTCLYSWFKSHFTHQFRFKVTLKVRFLGSVFFCFFFTLSMTMLVFVLRLYSRWQVFPVCCVPDQSTWPSLCHNLEM